MDKLLGHLYAFMTRAGVLFLRPVIALDLGVTRKNDEELSRGDPNFHSFNDLSTSHFHASCDQLRD
jgi:hypothetical protein